MFNQSMFNPWLSLTFETMRLGFDAQRVIALRMIRLAGGGATGRIESHRMVAEKLAAVEEVQAVAVSAIAKRQKDTVVGRKVLGVLKKRVRANKRRLSRQ